MPASAFSLVSLGPIINRWKYLVAGAVVLAAVVSLVVALLLPNIYQSTAVFLPTNPQTADPDRLLDQGKLELSGRAEDLDRVITIGESQPLAKRIIQRFHLYQHYDAGTPGDDLADNAVLLEFASNLSLVHNERDAIELTFMDRDKHLAANVANTMVTLIDSVNQQLTLENRRHVRDLYRQRQQYLASNYEQARRQLLSARRRYGIFSDGEQQGRYLAKELIETETALRKAEGGGGGNVAGLQRALRGLTRADGGNLVNVESYTQGLDTVNVAIKLVQDLQVRLIGARSVFETAELALRGQVSSIYMVQKAFPASKKTKPVRWLIVVGSVLLTFVLAIVTVALLELYRHNSRPQPTPAP